MYILTHCIQENRCIGGLGFFFNVYSKANDKGTHIYIHIHTHTHTHTHVIMLESWSHTRIVSVTSVTLEGVIFRVQTVRTCASELCGKI